MELQEVIEKTKELIKHKNDYDEAYGTKIYRPYSMSRKDWECVEIVLSELEKINKRIEYALDFAVDYDGYYNPDTKQGNAEGLAMTIDDMVDVLKGNLKGVE